MYGRRNVLWLPWPSGAAVARPSLPVRILQPDAIQTAAGIGFEVVHDPLRRSLRLHHRVHGIAAHMGRQQTPASTRAHLPNRFQNGIATDRVKIIGRLIHTLPFGCRARGILFQDRGSGHVVLEVDGAGFAAVQVTSVANEGDQVGHGGEPNFYRSLTFAARPAGMAHWAFCYPVLEGMPTRPPPVRRLATKCYFPSRSLSRVTPGRWSRFR